VETLTVRQAFDAMCLLLEDYYHMTKSDDIALLLSILTIVGDTTSDPAGWHDWMKSVQRVLWSDTPEHQQTLEELISDQTNFLGTDSWGSEWYAHLLADGRQVWAMVRHGKIQYGGIRQIPKTFNAQTGLSSPNDP
jgi:hypothetical protein